MHRADSMECCYLLLLLVVGLVLASRCDSAKQGASAMGWEKIGKGQPSMSEWGGVPAAPQLHRLRGALICPEESSI